MLFKVVTTALEILGTFFLAAEAIKLHNLKTLRESFLLRPTLWASPIARSLQATRTGQDLSGYYVSCLILLGAICIVPLALKARPELLHAWDWYQSTMPWPWVVAVVVAVPVLTILALILSFVGSFVIQMISVPVILAMLLLEYVEAHTASGLVGIIGFLLITVGAIARLGMELSFF
jgi:hypothetical protein